MVRGGTWETYGIDDGGEDRLMDEIRKPGEPDGDGGEGGVGGGCGLGGRHRDGGEDTACQDREEEEG